MFFGKNYHKCSKNRFQNILVVWQLPKKIHYRKILVKVVVREFGSYQNISTTTTFVKFWQFIVFQQLPKKIHHSKILLKVVATSSYQKRQLPKYHNTWVRNLEPGPPIRNIRITRKAKGQLPHSTRFFNWRGEIKPNHRIGTLNCSLHEEEVIYL